jgi:hypothetical protein
MKKNLIKSLMIGCLMLVSSASNAVTGNLTYFWTNGTSIGIIVDGLFYYSNNLPPAVITAIDVARQTQNGVVSFSATSSREITGAY